MKITACKIVDNGMAQADAERLFDKLETFAQYGFNKSHATAYSIISYFTMWLRVRYPAEYFAACMSIVAEDKLPGLVKDAREAGIELLPPDINRSADTYVIPDDQHILAPFNAVKGVSDTTARRIMELRVNNRDWKVVKTKRNGEAVYGMDEDCPVKGRFDTVQEFEYAAAEPGSKVNVRVVESLKLVGALANIDPGAKPARHDSRRKDQMELLPGLIIDSVKADRVTDLSEKFLRTQIIELAQDYKTKCEDCSLAGAGHPTVRCKSKVKFMVIADCPTWQEEREDKLLVGDAADFVKAAMKDAGLNVAEGYYTTLVKAKKDGKFLSNEQINGCAKYIEREIELIKPSVIVALGSATIKRLLPGQKSPPSELVGQAIYDPKLDASIVCGLNPVQLVFTPEKAELLLATFQKVAEILE
jgi:DNA polymerase-3 subunit alpha